MSPCLRALRPAVAAVALAAAGLAAAPRASAWGPAAPVAAPADWRAEFDEVCGKTQDAMTLDDGALRSLVARCDALLRAIERLDGPERKVYARRVQACRDLYQFVLDSRAPAAPR